jgi:hypothetical protein
LASRFPLKTEAGDGYNWLRKALPPGEVRGHERYR